jgi:putative SOS response-associated peptidase YedK
MYGALFGARRIGNPSPRCNISPPQSARKRINARAETAHERPMFKKALAHRRCLVAADGFYE